MNNKLAIVKGIAAFAVVYSNINLYGGSQTAIAATVTPNSASSTPLNQEVLLAQSRKNIDWGNLTWDFNVSNANIGTIRRRNILGETDQFSAITFLIEAKHSILAPVYFAYFFDGNGIQVGISPVVMEPNYGQWQAGNRANCYILIPPNADNAVAIKISRL
jgi:hypothetical protein